MQNLKKTLNSCTQIAVFLNNFEKKNKNIYLLIPFNIYVIVIGLLLI